MFSGERAGHRSGHHIAGGVATLTSTRSTLHVAVVMPAYNEEALEEFLIEIEDALAPVAASLRFVVVDDASTAALEVGRLPHDSPVEMLRNETNHGHGPSALRAYAAGLAAGVDVVVHVDGDGQFLGSDFTTLLEAVTEHDAVVGVRVGRSEPWFRRILTAGSRLITGGGLRSGDPNTPLRAYRAAALRHLMQSLSPNSAVPHLHFAMLHDRLGIDVAEVRVTHRPRRGTSTVGTTWQGARSTQVLPSGRLVRLAARATWELMRRGGARWWSFGALVVVSAAAVAPGFGMHLNFDEAYNLQVVTNLLHGHGYATDGALFAGHRQLFDYRITTGPTLLLPVTAAAALLGAHLWVYRIVPTIAFLALLATWWAVGRRLAGPRWASVGGAAAVLGILVLNTAGFVSSSQSGPGTVIGETAATLFLLLAIMLAGRPGWAGLCLGLAVMTKVLVLVAVPGVVVAVAISVGRSRAPRALTVLASVALVPAALWQVVRIATLGWSGAMSVNGDFLTFLHGHGAGSPDPVRQLVQQITIGPGFAAAVLLLSAAVAGGRLAAGWRPALPRDGSALFTGILVAGAGLEGYWLMLEREHFVRHSFQAGQLLVPLALVALVRMVPTLQARLLRDVIAAVAVALVAAQAALAIAGVWNPPGPSLFEQRQVSDLVAEQGPTYRYLWISMVPEITFFHPELHARPLDDSGGLVVLTGLFGRSRAHGCTRVVAEQAGYVVCDVAPAQVTRKNP